MSLFRSSPHLSTTVNGSTVQSLIRNPSPSTIISATITLAGRALITSASLANGEIALRPVQSEITSPATLEVSIFSPLARDFAIFLSLTLVHTPLKPHVCDVGPCTLVICCGHSYRDFRSVERPSSDPKTSRSTKRFTQKSIMLSISTPRPSPFLTRFTPEIVTNLWMMAPGFLPIPSLSMVTLQMVIVCNFIFRLGCPSSLTRP